MEDDAISNFCAITGATPDQARFFLESSGNDMEQAMSAFYDQEGDDDLPAEEAVPSEGAAPPAQGQQEQAGGVRQGQGAWPGASGGGGAGPSIRGGEVRGGAKKRPAGAGASGGGIRTLGDLGRAAEQDDSDEEGGPQEYYTGGEKSGMMVQDPSKKPGTSVDSIFDRARQHGAVDGTPADMLPSAPAARGAFTGSARTLGADGSPAVPEVPPAVAAAPAPERAVHTITFWRNGFTVDDGPLRKLEDPANAPFLNSINKGECPRELAPADARVMVHVNLVRKDADYEPPKEPKYRAFVGSGRTLGSTDSEPAPEPAASAPATASSNKSFEVDESQPFTSLQLRLLDGTRLVARFNHSHTVGDIRRFLERARPGATSSYRLVTSFPPKTLTDLDQTIEQAGLLNAVVMQKA
ncbi:UBX domain-containing protein 1 [Klebsormidium nitens]|uniref:UBX domain-containing protein 1 n=1 Tax=Klebsormidium nitens TaxID=105231 RepID=A0A0U9HJA9_KLENI|nr:UBX domain-containing protein 1 [Klebsormidium nitens]|eukprot:GAQ82005.1 UBX domain-containing protein 1 [Klebsormidium nitens]